MLACEVRFAARDSQMVSGEQHPPVEQAEPPRGVARLENQSSAPLQLPRAFPVEDALAFGEGASGAVPVIGLKVGG